MNASSRELVIAHKNDALKIDPLEAMQRGEKLFLQRLALAIKATTAGDWIAQGDNPYLRESGAQKIAARFGICISDMVIERENFEDEKGRYYVYTVTGVASWPATGRSIQEVGVCSSRDSFFGTKNGKLKSVQDVDIANIKKAAVTNFMGRAVLKILGLGGLTWEDLKQFGITSSGKTSVKYDGGASKAAASKTAQVAEGQAKKPFWTSDWNGKTYVHARIGTHFSEEFLQNLGFKHGKTTGTMNRVASPEIENALNDEYEAAEFSLREGGGNGTGTEEASSRNS